MTHRQSDRQGQSSDVSHLSFFLLNTRFAKENRTSFKSDLDVSRCWMPGSPTHSLFLTSLEVAQSSRMIRIFDPSTNQRYRSFNRESRRKNLSSSAEPGLVSLNVKVGQNFTLNSLLSISAKDFFLPEFVGPTAMNGNWLRDSFYLEKL